MTALHYASGHNIDGQGNFVPAQAGFNLADVSSVAQLNALPDGVMGLVWLNEGDGVTQEFIDKVTPFIGNPKLYGFFLKDEPDVTGKWGPLVTAEDLKAESDWIHANVPSAKTFITMMNMGTAADPTYGNTYTPENTHIDLFGITGYPVRSESSTVDYDMIDRNVAAAQAAGISVDQIVPVYQTFGGGNWVTEAGGRYVMPTAAQQQEMFEHWEAVVPNPAFDYAYAWGSQNGDVALESSQALKDLFLQHNNSVDTTPDTGGIAPPVVDAGGNTPPDDDTDGSTPPVVDAGGGRSPAGGTTTDPTTPSIDPTPVNDGHGSWHHGRGDGFGSGHGHGLDFSQLMGGGRFSWSGSSQSDGGGESNWFGSSQLDGDHGFNWFGSSQTDHGGGFSWSGFSQPGGDGRLSWDGSSGHDVSATADPNAGTNFVQLSLVDGMGRFGLNHDHQSWDWWV